MVIRIEMRDGRSVLTVKIADGRSGFDIDGIKSTSTKTLSPEEWASLKTSLENNDFWNLTPYRASYELDGSEWILEGKTSTKYQVVNRSSLSDKTTGDGLLNICRKIADLGEVRVFKSRP